MPANSASRRSFTRRLLPDWCQRFTPDHPDEDLKVSNPVTGHQYKKDYLLKARKVLVDVDMLKLITSFGHVVFIEAGTSDD
eukprot:2375991-Amphidinium_carterae.2